MPRGRSTAPSEKVRSSPFSSDLTQDLNSTIDVGAITRDKAQQGTCLSSFRLSAMADHFPASGAMQEADGKVQQETNNPVS